MFISVVLSQIAVRPLPHQHGNQITRYCEPSSSLVLPLQPQSYPSPAVRTTMLKFASFLSWWISSVSGFFKKIIVYNFHDPPSSSSVSVSVNIHSKSEVAVTKSPRLDIMLNNNLQKKLRIFSRRKLTTMVRMSHWWSRADVGDLSVTCRAVYSSIGPLQSSAVWLGSTEDHAVTVDRPARIRDANQAALRKSARIRVSSTERVNQGLYVIHATSLNPCFPWSPRAMSFVFPLVYCFSCS